MVTGTTARVIEPEGGTGALVVSTLAVAVLLGVAEAVVSD